MKKLRFFIIDAVALCLCAVLLIAVGVGVYALPRAEFSEAENRALAAFPTVSVRSVADGSFFSRLCAFYADAVPMREQLVRTKAYCELSLGKSQNNGVIFLPDGRLVDRCEYKSTRTLDANLTQISALLSSRERAVCALVPRSVDIYTQSESARRLIDSVYARMGGEELYLRLADEAEQGGEVYFMTDHHLDADGVYVLYCYVVEQFGVAPLAREEFIRRTVSADFLGSTYSSSGLVDTVRDTVELWRYEGDGEYEVRCEDQGCRLDSLYCFDALAGKDKYRVFTDGNHGVLRVSAVTDKTRPTLLVVKDSFANALLPLLARHFDLTVCDPRYSRSPLPQCDYTAIVFGIDTLATTGMAFAPQ